MNRIKLDLPDAMSEAVAERAAAETITIQRWIRNVIDAELSGKSTARVPADPRVALLADLYEPIFAGERTKAEGRDPASVLLDRYANDPDLFPATAKR